MPRIVTRQRGVARLGPQGGGAPVAAQLGLARRLLERQRGGLPPLDRDEGEAEALVRGHVRAALRPRIGLVDRRLGILRDQLDARIEARGVAALGRQVGERKRGREQEQRDHGVSGSAATVAHSRCRSCARDRR